MCGIAGILRASGQPSAGLAGAATQMANAIRHRGPDDSGVWTDEPAGIALAHRRLSVIDLSPAGHQPMVSGLNRFVMVFNGEIYNHLALRAELEGVQERTWRGHSDTETLLCAFEAWGIEATLAKTVGMFALALWDARDRTLHLARDRFGEKPLFYGWSGGAGNRAFIFGSELKALRSFPGFTNAISRDSLAQYMRFMYVPAPGSIYEGIYKLEPGCLLSISGAAPEEAPSVPLRPPANFGNLCLHRWWSLATVVEAGARTPVLDESQAIETLEERLSEAVKLQCLADVPLGAFLSGGVDSSTIVALMQKQSTRPVRTFTVGFEEADFDESPYARAVAEHLGTEHEELFVSASEAQAVIARLPAIYDEPFADSSQIPTHLVCAAARQHVTVALSGDAGDELFGGYNRYFWGPRIWSRVAWLAYPIRQALGSAITALPMAGWEALGRPINAALPSGNGIARVGEKAHKLASRLRGVRNLDDLYLSLVSEWEDPAQVVRGCKTSAVDHLGMLEDPLPSAGVPEGPLRMMYRDSTSYLPDDILCKVDRAAMAVSLETRVPFLDHRVVELAWQLPLAMKIRRGQGKWALRQVLYRHVPQRLIDRPKSGFGIPVGQWLRGPLRSWAENLLEESRLERDGFFHVEPIRRKWAEHLSGARDHTTSLWAVLMFGAWLEGVS